MNQKSSNNGGYYALLGFEFQIDRTILEILNSSDQNLKVYFELIQDINTDSFVMQIKYKEAQSFTPSSIRQPVIQLLDLSKSDNKRHYSLFAHFGNLNGYENFVDGNKKIDGTKLESILGDDRLNYTEEEKNSFIKRFILDFGPTFQDQFDQVISELQALGFGEDYDEALFYYSNITDYLRKLVVLNKENIEKRHCTKKDILKYIKTGRSLIFSRAFKDFKGEKAYLHFVKSKVKKLQNTNHNFIFLGPDLSESSSSIGQFIAEVVNKYYKHAAYNLKPLTLIVDTELVGEVKKYLISEEIIFNDGYEEIEFNSNIFFRTPIINKKLSANGRATESLGSISFKLRLLSRPQFDKIKEMKFMPHLAYYINTEAPPSFETIPSFKIESLSLNAISEVLI